MRHSFCQAPDRRPDSHRLLSRYATTPSSPCSLAVAIIFVAGMLKLSLTCEIRGSERVAEEPLALGQGQHAHVTTGEYQKVESKEDDR